MNISKLKDLFFNDLHSVYDRDEIESFFSILLENYLGFKKVDFFLNSDFIIDGSQLKKWKETIKLLKQEKPIQYILNEAWFYGYTLFVDEHVLIPRSETEELVEWIIADVSDKIVENDIHVLDIGTGTGCIPIALKKELPKIEVSAIDISSKSLEIAQKNASQLQTDVQFYQIDILTANQLPSTFDIIVSNPPYVRHLEKEEIKKNVLDYEPHLALFVEDNDALLFYRKIGQLAKNYLNKNGKLYFEINQYLGNQTVDLLQNMGYKNCILKKDLKGNDRMICAYL